MQQRKATAEEIALVTNSWLPGMPSGDLTIDTMDFLMQARSAASTPLAAYVLNRVSVWLETPERWTGDENLSAEWEDNVVGRSCTLRSKLDGSEWKVDWGLRWNRVDRPIIGISKISEAGIEEVVDGEITTNLPGSGNRRNIVNAPPPVAGTVDAHLRVDAFDLLMDFCDAIRPSIPASLLAIEDTVTFDHAYQLRELKPILEADGGLPGRLCGLREKIVRLLASQAGCDWILSKHEVLLDHLRNSGAIWGQAVMNYNDGDYSSCVVDMPDGSLAFFEDNAASVDAQRSFVAHFVKDGDRTKAVEVHVFGGDEDYLAKIEAIRNGTSSPDYVHDFVAGTPSFPGGRMGHNAMTLLLWQFLAADHHVYDSGSLESDVWYWRHLSATPAI